MKQKNNSGGESSLPYLPRHLPPSSSALLPTTSTTTNTNKRKLPPLKSINEIDWVRFNESPYTRNIYNSIEYRNLSSLDHQNPIRKPQKNKIILDSLQGSLDKNMSEVTDSVQLL